MKLFLLLLVLCAVAANENVFDMDIEDSVIQELLFDGDDDPSTGLLRPFDQFLQQLMIRFRSKVLKLYRRLTCSKDEMCDPHHFLRLLPASSAPDEISFQQNLLEFELTGFERLEGCRLTFDPSSYAIVQRRPHYSLVILSEQGTGRIRLFSILDEGGCTSLAQMDTSLTSPCLHSLSIQDDLELVIVWPCRTGRGLIHIYIVANTGLETFQLLEAERIDSLFSIIHSGHNYLCLVTNGQCQLYEWTGTNFDLSFQRDLTAVGIGHVVEQFVHGANTFLMSISNEIVDKGPIVVLWKLQWSNDEMHLEPYQFLNDCKAKDFHRFEVGGMQFVAVACADVSDSFLYWWGGSQFLMWQVIGVKLRTAQWTSLRLDNGEAVLIAKHYNERYSWLRAYSLNQGHYQPTAVESEFLDGEGLVTSHRLHQLITTGGTRDLNIYRIVTRVFDVQVVEDHSNQCVDQLERMVDRQLAMNIELQMELDNYNSMIESSHFAHVDCGSLEGKFESMDERVKSLEEEYDTWRRSFQRPRGLRVNELVVSDFLSAEQVTVSEETVNRIHLPLLYRSVLTKSSEQIFDASVIFDGDLTVQRLDTSSTINGVSYSNVATSNGGVAFTHPQLFQSLRVDVAKIGGKLNDINTTDWVLNREVKRGLIHGRKTFKHLVIRGQLLLIGGAVNQVNVGNFFSSVWTRSGDEEVKGEVEVIGNVLVGGQLITKSLNGVDVHQLSQTMVTADTKQQFQGLSGAGLNVDQLIVRGRINGVRVTQDLLTLHTQQNISFPVTLRGDVKVNSDVKVVSGVVNGVSNWSTTLVTRCGDQTITGRKVFTEAVKTNVASSHRFRHVFTHFGDINVDHLTVVTLNDVDDVSTALSSSVVLSRAITLNGRLRCRRVRLEGPVILDGKLDQLYVTTRLEQNISTPLVFVGEKVTVDGNMRMEDKINGVNMNRLSHDCLFKSGDQMIAWPITMETATCLGSVHVLDYDTLLVHLLHQVDWRLTSLELWRDVHMEGDLDCQYLNGIDLDSFLSRLYSVHDDDIQVYGKVFHHLAVTGDFDLNTRLNGVNSKDLLNSVVRLTTDQIITGDWRVTRPVLCLSSGLNTEAVNGMVLERHLSQLAQRDSSGAIHQSITFLDGLEVLGDIVVQSLNHRNISKRLENILLESAQEFSSPVSFNGKITIGELKVLGTINGVKTADWLLVDDNRTFDGQVVFKSATTFSTLTVNATTNIGTLGYHEYLSIDAQHVELNGLLNGLTTDDLPSKILSRTRVQVVSNPRIIFHANVTVDRLTTMKRPVVNGVQLDEFIDRGLSTDLPQRIKGSVYFSESSEVGFEEEVDVRGDLKFQSLSPLDITHTRGLTGGWAHVGHVIFEDRVTVQGYDQPNPLRFAGSVETENVTVHSVNGVKLKQLVNDRVTLLTNETVQSSLRLKEVIKGCRDVIDSKSIIEEDLEFRCPVVLGGALRTNRNFTLLV